MMWLPKDLEIQFRQDFYRLEEEKHMPYVTSIERMAREEGLEEGKQKGLESGARQGLLDGIETALSIKFGDEGAALLPDIQAIADVARLRDLLVSLKTVATVAELRQRVADVRNGQGG